MADELTSQVDASPAPPTGQATETSSETPQAAPTKQPVTGTDSQPTEQVERQSVNLQELPEFREWQSKITSTYEQQRRQLDASLREQAERNAYLQQQLESISTKDMTQDELMAHELNKARQQTAMTQKQLQDLQYEISRQRAMQMIAAETGVDVDEILDADSPDDAWRRGAAKVRKENEKLRKELEAYKRESSAPQTDLGQNKSASSDPTLDQYLKGAVTAQDLARLLIPGE